LVEKLHIVATQLVAWSKKRYPNARKKIEELKEELLSRMNNHTLQYDHGRIQNIHKEIEALWRQEEMFWGLRSRIKWLKWGDRNTKFFHATTIQRRNRNRITMLMNAEGDWVRDNETLKHMTVDFFQNLYTSVGPRNFQPILNNIPLSVDATMNLKLTEAVTMEEVYEATHQLGATKAPGLDGLNGLFFQ